MECPKCGCQDMKSMSGISKKNGKPWAGMKCQNKECGEMIFQKTQSFAPKAASSGGSSEVLTELRKQTALLEKIAGIKKPIGAGLTAEEMVPDEEVPF